jgi:DNA-directed RNA polymerase subunit beta'
MNFMHFMGAEGIRELLRNLDLTERSRIVCAQSSKLPSSEAKNKKLAKRLKILEGFQKVRYQT